MGLLKGVSEGSVHAESSPAGANPPLYHNPKMRDFFHLTPLRHQNIKTSLCPPTKNGSVMPLFVIFRSARKKLQLTVSFEHPVFSLGEYLHCLSPPCQRGSTTFLATLKVRDFSTEGVGSFAPSLPESALCAGE